MTELVLTDTSDHVAVVTLNRPDKRNALSRDLMEKLVATLRKLDGDESVRVIVLRGDERAFSAGADIGALSQATSTELYTSGFSELWDEVALVRTPMVAAVAGYALGGGLELAMICDVIIAADDAMLGLPETGLGIIPGAGGTQRLVASVGKALAMDVLLTGRRLDAHEALISGLVSRVVPADELMAEALATARDIAVRGPLANRLAKHAVLTALDSSLTSGIAHERTLSALVVDSEDRAEGMRAFASRTTPAFVGR